MAGLEGGLHDNAYRTPRGPISKMSGIIFGDVTSVEILRVDDADVFMVLRVHHAGGVEQQVELRRSPLEGFAEPSLSDSLRFCRP